MIAQTASPAVPLAVRRDGDRIYSPLRKTFLVETPEERVRQEYLCVLVNEYGYVLEQMAEEVNTTGRGTGQARADFVIWRTSQDKQASKKPLIVVECKSDNVTISDRDYRQGENYARITDAPFFVTHNNRETRFWRVLKDKMPGYVEEITNIPHASDSDKQIKELIAQLKTFSEDEFANTLQRCHDIIWKGEHLDPLAAFDEIAKVLFVKIFVERELKKRNLRENRFTTKVLEQQFADDPINSLFRDTKEAFRNDRLFEGEASRKINLLPSTSLEIVGLLERYNLSDTGEDVKGIAFERFLARTLRGTLGQYFTPRSIVEFMVQMVDPQEGDVICDPASGSGGFLIRTFEIVRERITAKVDAEYQAFEATLAADSSLDTAEKARLLRAKDAERMQSLNSMVQGSRLWTLANRCLYGTDANERLARTSKMNMILHGDGHGGVHHHNGFLNVNGIFEGRFDIILTNPPFGSSVESSHVVRPDDARVEHEARQRYENEYGDLYRAAQAKMETAVADKTPIAALFDMGREGKGSAKSEILFIERCLSLLKPGGRLGIVLPEGIFNNPSLGYVREYCEDRAFIRAVISLPQETFYSSGASVKASLLFLQKFTVAEKMKFDAEGGLAKAECAAAHEPEILAAKVRFNTEIAAAKAAKDASKVKEGMTAAKAFEKRMAAQIAAEARALLKRRFAYPIFLYEAEKVGITATGDPDLNELVPNDRVPAGLEQTCLEVYQAFRANPSAFLPLEVQAS